jgi:Uma2 family endonuclease
MTTAQTASMTAEEFWEWASRRENGDQLYELDRGEVVEVPPPGPAHGTLCSWISHLLWSYVSRRGAGLVMSNDTGLLLSRQPDTVRGPGVMLFAESRPLRKIGNRYEESIPQLVVEVLSPNDRWARLSVRISQYLKRGVPLVWVVDPEERVVTVHCRDELPRVFDEQTELTGNGVLPDFALKVSTLFALPGAAQDEPQP